MNLIENGKDLLKKTIKKLDNLHKGFDSLEYECRLKRYYNKFTSFYRNNV